jgi:hypothetical protein
LPDQGTGLIVGGLGLGTITYFVTALMGAVAIDKARTTDDKTRGKYMMIPFAGPFMAIPKTDSAVRRFGLATSGTVQVAALAILVVGGIKHARYREAKRWSMAAAPSGTGGNLTVHVRF